MGRSSASLELCVIKRGLHVHEEGAHCMVLGPAVAPRIHAVGTDFYIMEHLLPCPLFPELPRAIEHMLASMVWDRDPMDCRADWAKQLHESTGIAVPHWALESEGCLTHGDPTIANVMMRPTTTGVQQFVLCDPVPPGRRVPQSREIDQAKIVQSMMGWETMIGGLVLRGDDAWEMPDFLRTYMGDAHARRLCFWVGVNMMRAKQHLKFDHPEHPDLVVWHWCNDIEQEMFRAVGI